MLFTGRETILGGMDMLEIIKKTLFTGLGVAYLTKEKLEELTKEIAAKGNLSEKEGRELADELLSKSQEARDRLESQIGEMVQTNLRKLDLATKDDVARLEEQIASLRAKISGDNGPA